MEGRGGREGRGGIETLPVFSEVCDKARSIRQLLLLLENNGAAFRELQGRLRVKSL